MTLSSFIYELSEPQTLYVREEQLNLSTLADNAVAASTICSVVFLGTETAAYTGQPPLRPGKQYPRDVEYCNVAKVVTNGKAVAGLSPGQRIATLQSQMCPADLQNNFTIISRYGDLRA
jgi:hypothetical protein